MTLPGGPADKLGNRYETWWTVSALVRMLHGDADAIRIEVPGVDKAEFVVTTGAYREFHQVKRSHPNGKWSLAALRADGLVSAIGRILAGNQNRFVFASGSDAHELVKLSEAAAARSRSRNSRVFSSHPRGRGEGSRSCALVGGVTFRPRSNASSGSMSTRSMSVSLKKRCVGASRCTSSQILRRLSWRSARWSRTPCTAQSPANTSASSSPAVVICCAA